MLPLSSVNTDFRAVPKSAFICLKTESKVASMKIVQGQCPICTSWANVQESTQRARVECHRCGSFAITSTAWRSFPPLAGEEIIKISGWIRDNPGVTIGTENFPKPSDLRMPSVGEKAEKILLWLERKCPIPGTPFTFKSHFNQPKYMGDDILEMQGVGWISNSQEAEFLLTEYLCKEKGFLRPPPQGQTLWSTCFITPKGWAYLDSLRQANPRSAIGFIAMWFDDSLNSAFVAIEQGIWAAGYSALRIDQKKHNNKIDDEIIAGIRRSKFLVADFTGHRGGVYFEAGFAKGLGLEVIWLCREDDLEKLHFDTRQYSHIPWQEGKLPELAKALKDRIEATIGHGPINEDLIT